MKKRTRFITMLIAVALMCGIGTASAASEKVQKDIYYNGIKITLNGNTVTPKTESGNVVDPFLMDGTTYLPVRALANALGMGVDWEGETRTVLLTSSNTSSAGALSPSAVFAQCSPSVVHIHTAFGGGTGFFIEKNVIATNNHVIDGTPYATAVTADGKEYKVTEIIARSKDPDLALLRVDGTGTPLKLNTGNAAIGSDIYSIGAPMGIFPTFSDGMVMNNTFSENGVSFYLGNIGAISGNSGGPVLNAKGEVIGVVQGGMSDGTNSMDMIIKASHINAMDRSHPSELGFDETRDEENYTKASLASARVGQIVSFGRYEQNCNEASKEEILWLVVEKNGSTLTLMSLYGLDVVPFMSNDDPATWEKSHARSFLNNEFYNNAFTSSEKAKIKSVTVTTPDNPVHGTDGGSNTTDKVYLPSLEEVMKYYNITTAEEKFYDGLYAQATPYAVSKGVWLELAGSSKCWWWLRSSGGSDQNAAEVGSAGYLSFNGSDASSTVRALRPVIQVVS